MDFFRVVSTFPYLFTILLFIYNFDFLATSSDKIKSVFWFFLLCKKLSGKNDSKSRVGGTMASSIYLMMQGVQILRIHDVNEIMQGIKVFKKIINN